MSFNFILYFAVFVCFVFRTNKIKEFGRIFLISIISLAFCVCYNSLNLLKFEFAYFQPYLLLALVLGVICSALTKNYKTAFCGLFIGISITELIRSGSVFYIQNNFCLGDSQFVTLMLVSIVSYIVLNSLIYVVGKIKTAKKQKSNLQN